MPDLLKNAELESWTLRVVEQVKSGAPLEDSAVEAKREWPADTRKAARQLAGHGNAARGEAILWIIGLDLTSNSVVNADRMELANWWPAVEACFEDLAPALRRDLVVRPEPTESVVALLFETSRAPYVVTTGLGKPQFEVPWRAGTGTRTARRSELIELLTPHALAPEVEVLDGTIKAETIDKKDHQMQRWSVRLELYFVPVRTEDLIVIPFHRCWAQLDMPDGPIDFYRVRFSPPKDELTSTGISKRTIESSAEELLIRGPGMATLLLDLDRNPPALDRTWRPKLQGELSFAPGDAKASFSILFDEFYVNGNVLKWGHMGKAKLRGLHIFD